MTRDELVAAISERIGLELKEVDDRPGELAAISPNGARLFTVTVFGEGGTWHFGGCGTLLPDHWSKLCRLGDD